ncbi:hypothetical protein HanRHA438_Chr08g0333661 [Helianthus annuus]|nr:hypothetical protein HanRHA438_Chr08g0333661 [Helianthus annuus]
MRLTRILVLIKSPKTSVCNSEKNLTPLNYFNGRVFYKKKKKIDQFGLLSANN